MIFLSDQDQAKVSEALRLAAIYIQDHPSPDSPVREIGEALELVTSRELEGRMDRVAELEDLLAEVLEAIYNQGAHFVPPLTLVDKMQRTLSREKKIT